MPVVAVVKCKKYGSEIRSDWKFCPKCSAEIVCTGKYEQLCAKKFFASRQGSLKTHPSLGGYLPGLAIPPLKVD